MISYSYSFLSDLSKSELLKVENLLETEMSKGNNFIASEAIRLLKGGGKRIRPLMCILFSQLSKDYSSTKAVPAAAALETLHMATLVHDDTIDNAENRRGVETTFKKHGIHTAVYTGDWMFVKALQMLSSVNESQYLSNELMKILANSIESICNGEIDQYYGRGKIPTINQYYSRIKEKTAALFAGACYFGAKNAGLSDSAAKSAMDFGNNFGIAFQILDDILDIESSSKTTGKPVTNDLNEGIITLPILLSCKKNNNFKKKVNDFLNDPAKTNIDKKYIYSATIELGGLDMAYKEAKDYIEKCFSYTFELEDTSAKQDILALIKNTFSYFDK